MHVRHLAWLHAVPDGKKQSRLQAFESRTEDAPQLKLPPIEGAEYLVQLLFEAGLVKRREGGFDGLEWIDIQAWLGVTDLTLSTWEKLLIKNMSQAYASEYNLSLNGSRLPPYMHVDDDEAKIEIDREAVGNKMKALLRSMKKQ